MKTNKDVKIMVDTMLRELFELEKSMWDRYNLSQDNYLTILNHTGNMWDRYNLGQDNDLTILNHTGNIRKEFSEILKLISEKID